MPNHYHLQATRNKNLDHAYLEPLKPVKISGPYSKVSTDSVTANREHLEQRIQNELTVRRHQLESNVLKSKASHRV